MSNSLQKSLSRAQVQKECFSTLQRLFIENSQITTIINGESFSRKIQQKTKIPTFTTSSQHNTRGTDKSTLTGKQNKRQVKTSLFADYITQRINIKYTPYTNSSVYSFIHLKQCVCVCTQQNSYHNCNGILHHTRKKYLQEMINRQKNFEKEKQSWKQHTSCF